MGHLAGLPGFKSSASGSVLKTLAGHFFFFFFFLCLQKAIKRKVQQQLKPFSRKVSSNSLISVMPRYSYGLTGWGGGGERNRAISLEMKIIKHYGA